MKSRMSRCVALIGTALSLSSFAQVCNEVTLYESGENGTMESNRTFPEGPEWSANWGTMGTLVPPYIRWSGQKNAASDWTGLMTMKNLPTYVQGGKLTMDVRSTQKAKLGVWLEGSFGKSSVHYQNLEANISTEVAVDLSSLFGSGRVLVQKIGVGLFNVPAYQYTTLFADNVKLTCSASDQENVAEVSYPYSGVSPASAVRENRFMESTASVTFAVYDETMRKKIADSTHYDFLLDDSEHQQILRYAATTPLSSKRSRDGWYKSMYLIQRNRLKDSVIANPKTLFHEASAFAASTENCAMPILIGNVDYGVRVCKDSTCNAKAIVGAKALVAGLPVTFIKGSELKLYYDPYFISTNRQSIPSLEIFSENQWNPVPLKSEFLVKFESAGVQKIQLRLKEGGSTINQTLVVEVK